MKETTVLSSLSWFCGTERFVATVSKHSLGFEHKMNSHSPAWNPKARNPCSFYTGVHRGWKHAANSIYYECTERLKDLSLHRYCHLSLAELQPALQGSNETPRPRHFLLYAWQFKQQKLTSPKAESAPPQACAFKTTSGRMIIHLKKLHRSYNFSRCGENPTPFSKHTFSSTRKENVHLYRYFPRSHIV